MEFTMIHGLKTILYPVTDLAQTKSLYGQLLDADQGRR
jgi:extradiol dioxygenase family protein